jgi:hypothetical protein
MATSGFRLIVGLIALAVFIALMVMLYWAAEARGKHIKYPPNVPACPDFFVSNPSGSGCLLPPGLANRESVLAPIRAKNTSLADKLANEGLLQIPSGSLCAFTENNGLSWNGISNVHPCVEN